MKKIAFIFVATLLLVSCKHVEPIPAVTPVDSTLVAVDSVVVDTTLVDTDTIKPSKPVLEGTK